MTVVDVRHLCEVMRALGPVTYRIMEYRATHSCLHIRIERPWTEPLFDFYLYDCTFLSGAPMGKPSEVRLSLAGDEYTVQTDDHAFVARGLRLCGEAIETIESQGLSAERIAANQLLNPGAAGSGAYISSQEATAAYYGDLAGLQGRGLGPAVVRIETSAAAFRTFAARHGISIETLIPRGPFPGATETLIPLALIEEFNRMCSFLLHQ